MKVMVACCDRRPDIDCEYLSKKVGAKKGEIIVEFMHQKACFDKYFCNLFKF
jgi:hypothetical protein